MNQSLYHIQNDLLEMFSEIENNEGEITDEAYAALTIKQDDLKTKLDNYVKACLSWEADEKACDNEIKRLKARKDMLANRSTRLKNMILQAVLTFGYANKNGNKSIEGDIYKFSTRRSEKSIPDTARIKVLIDEFERYITELIQSGIEYTNLDVDLQGILSAVNANVIASMGDEYPPFTLNDLSTIKLEISSAKSIYELFREGGHMLKQYVEQPFTTEIKDVTAVGVWKGAIKNFNDNEEVSDITLATIVENTTLQIK